MAASRVGFFFKPGFKANGENIARTANFAIQMGLNLALVHFFANKDNQPPQFNSPYTLPPKPNR